MRALRRATQLSFVALLLLMPVFDILRIDVAARELYVFRHVWDLGLGEAFYAAPGDYGAGYVALHFFLKAILPWLLVLSVFPALGFVLGRAFCGWACPEGALFELADHITLKLIGRRSIYGAAPNDPPGARGRAIIYVPLTVLYLLSVPAFFGVMLSGYFIAPARIWREVIALSPSFGLKAGVVGVSAYMVITFIFVRHAICKYLCGAGLMQMLLGWVSPISLAVRYGRARNAECTDCRECERVCFMGVKPRSGKKDISCVNCGECIEACGRELGHKRTLFGFRFGGR